jgi:hypothetical protein
VSRFRRMTPRQREVLDALKALREVVVMPGDARPLKALKRRGLIRYRRVDGVRIAQYRDSAATRRARQRDERQWQRLRAVFSGKKP